GSDITLYPNPASTSFTLSLQTQTGSRMEVILTDLGGRIIYHRDLKNGTGGTQEMRVDVSALPVGTYHCSVTEDGALRGTRKLVITR
ncbi:MAG TPA: T9SS type A sorting domain-containing protein, partial [Bacteroidales bacterium]|nr:T9SS type A sorting domain-containing protein [Bacteroidales bacterium]